MRDSEISFVVMTRGGERYVFIFDDAHIEELAETVLRFARDPELSFNICDAMGVGKALKSMYERLEREKGSAEGIIL